MSFKVPVMFKVGYDEAVDIAKILFDLIRHRHWLISLPGYRLPRNLVAGSREHALYLTYVISIDYMTEGFGQSLALTQPKHRRKYPQFSWRNMRRPRKIT